MPEIWFPNLGIEIAHLDRTAFTLFGRSVYWYGIFIGLAVVIGVWLALREAKRQMLQDIRRKVTRAHIVQRVAHCKQPLKWKREKKEHATEN
mgnify:CR=1 FL=1